MERGRFINGDKEWVHMRAGKRCEFPRGCPRPNNGIVHHLTGRFEGHLKGMPNSILEDVSQNAFMLCDLHAEMHDIQEREQVEGLINERYKSINFRPTRTSNQRLLEQSRRKRYPTKRH